jgi:MFS family permease
MTTETLPAPRFTSPYKGLVLGLLLAAYTVNFIDRTIISIVGPAIRADLGLSSVQVGMLGGLYFALLYTLLGIPLARLAERTSRVNILVLSLVVWSAFTALCGAATNFAMLALCRFGVGVGEAGCTPPAHSLISDYFEPRKRATAMAVYGLGVPLGIMFGAAAGGWIAQHLGWRVAFVVVGVPGVILALVFKLLVKEPPRGHADRELKIAAGQPVEAASPPPAFSIAHELREIGAVAKALFGKWPVLHMCIGVTLVSFAAYGANQFTPQYFVAAFGLDLTAVGLIIGLIAGVSAGAGTLLGGLMADRLGRRNAAWYALTPAFGLAICVPLYLLAFVQPSWKSAALVLLIPGLFHYTYLGPTFAVVQNSVDVRRRATATAVLFLFLNLIALGGGPPFTGWVIDQLAEIRFAGVGAGNVWALIHGWVAGDQSATGFAAACPGGNAAAAAAPALIQSCHAALSDGTRGGLVVTVFFYAWASLHYFLAAIGMSRHLRDPQK